MLSGTSIVGKHPPVLIELLEEHLNTSADDILGYGQNLLYKI